MKLTRILLVLVVAALGAGTAPTAAPQSRVSSSLSGCVSDLDTLRRRTVDAGSAAEDAERERQELNDAVEAMDDARDEVDTYCGLMRDRLMCQMSQSELDSKRSAAQRAERDFNWSRDSLESALDTMRRALRSVESSCEGAGGQPAVVPGVRPEVQPLCRQFMSMREMVRTGPIGLQQKTDLMATCRQQTFGLNAEECRICAGE